MPIISDIHDRDAVFTVEYATATRIASTAKPSKEWTGIDYVEM
jgi:hypothetical protein